MARCVSVLFFILALAPGQLLASSLAYSIEGVRGELKKNIAGWLGAEPGTAEERSNFIASARERTASSLKALGYYQPDIQVAVDRESSPWAMIVRVTPNAPALIADIDIQVLGEAADDSEFSHLLESLPFAPGDILHHGVYEKFKRKLLALGLRRGYFDGVADRSRVEVNVDENSANITLHYTSGQRYRFGQIRLDERMMDMSWVDSVIRFRQGEVFDLSLLQQLRSELQQTRYFSTVIVRPQLDELADGHVPVSVTLSPVSRHNFEFGVGFSTDTEERLSVTWRTPLVNRHGHSQETRLEYSAINPSGLVHL